MIDQTLEELLDGCRRGDEAAQRAFYERYYAYALSVCLAYANDREDARELANDGFMKAFRRIDSLAEEKALLAWLRRIMVNTALDHYRRRRRSLTISLDAGPHEPAEPHLNDEAIFAQLSAEHIIAVLQQLPLPYRLVFSLYVLEGYSHQEIARQLGLAESTSRAHLTEANKRLRQALSQQINHTNAPTRR